MPPPRRPSRTDPEALRALRERLEATQEAAQRLAEEATRSVGGDRPPASGWDVPHRADRAGEELDAIVKMIAGLRDVLPDELRAQLADLARQVLAFVRAVLDWWIDRMENGPAPAADRDDGVQDIPIS